MERGFICSVSYVKDTTRDGTQSLIIKNSSLGNGKWQTIVCREWDSNPRTH